MLHTAEMRWFVTGALPDAIAAWFHGGMAALRSETRTDHYLVFPGSAAVGVKVREGRFEIKARCGEPQLFQLATQVQGHSDCWLKWSTDVPPTEAWIAALLAEPQGWFAVSKTRWTRRFVQEGATIREVKAEQEGQLVCSVELAQIDVGSSAWWSIGLEAQAAPDTAQELLRRVGVVFFAHQPPGTPLDAAASFAYPSWLSRVSGT